MELLYKRHAWHDKVLKIHIICWTVFIFLEVLVAVAINQHFSSLSYYVLFYTLNICLFYFHAHVAMRFSKLRYLAAAFRFIIILLCELVVYIGISMLISLFLEQVMHSRTGGPLVFNFRYFAIVLYRAAFFIAYGTGYYYLMEYLERKKAEMTKTVENEQLRSQLIVMEKDYLRAQINPHLFFNTLGFIKIASKRNPEKSDDAIEKLVHILDYALETNKGECVALRRELEQIEHMIQLNQLRYDNTLNLDFHKNIINAEIRILPLMLLTLVENMFKHGNLLDKNNPASIEINDTDALLIFKTSNLVANNINRGSDHTGLKNIQDRLQKSYPGKYLFEFGTDQNFFRAELTIYL